MNRLAHESSPYLLQHRNNPVNWYPWSDEALGRARAEDKPIFLSIGYSACHWCHVMEHESFESPAIAALLNEHFVCIKVDREERPDLDHIYMQAVQMITGRGGWPLSAFLTPELQPFYGGTYWPPTTRMGMPGFDDILKGVIGAWSERRDQALEQAAQLTAAIGEGNPFIITTTGSISEELFQKARQRWSNTFDSTHGGFGGAPKFPRSVELQMLLRSWYRDRDSQTLEMVCLTLDKMAAGGMYDQLGGGFARYSVDAQWLVPHFEKMLYDNALLVDAYLDAYQVTGRERYAEIVQETLDYILRDMVDSENGFHSTEDADSEGVEGKYYVWSLPEIESILGADLAQPFCQTYGVTRQGNFEGQNILHLSKPLASLGDTSLSEAEKDQAITLSRQLRDARAKLLAHREQRVRPGKDDKVLVSWNGLMIHALARAACLLKRDEYLEAAQRAAKFILTEMRREDGRLLHCYRGGIAKLDAYLDDYACLANSLITLYESDFNEQWLEQAEQLCEIVMEHFQDAAEGGFFFTADDHEQLVARTKEWVDASVPGSNAMMATALLRLGKLTGRPDLLAAGQRTVETAAGMLEKAPEASGQMLIAADLLLGPTWELVVVTTPDTPETDEVISRLYNTFLPRKVLACRQRTVSSQKSQRLTPLFTGKVPVPGTTQLYVCHDHTCQQPVVGAADITAKINELATG